MIMIDAKGLPIAAYSTNAATHESRPIQELFQFMVNDQLPQRLIGDKAMIAIHSIKIFMN